MTVRPATQENTDGRITITLGQDTASNYQEHKEQVDQESKGDLAQLPHLISGPIPSETSDA
jgi:hypothetical protein